MRSGFKIVAQQSLFAQSLTVCHLVYWFRRYTCRLNWKQPCTGFTILDWKFWPRSKLTYFPLSLLLYVILSLQGSQSFSQSKRQARCRHHSVLNASTAFDDGKTFCWPKHLPAIASCRTTTTMIICVSTIVSPNQTNESGYGLYQGAVSIPRRFMLSRLKTHMCIYKIKGGWNPGCFTEITQNQTQEPAKSCY